MKIANKCKRCPELLRLPFQGTLCYECYREDIRRMTYVRNFNDLLENTDEIMRTIEGLEKRIQFLVKYDVGPRSPDFRGDIVFIGSDSTSVYAHRFIMAGKSAVLKKMFDVDMIEKEIGTVRVADATGTVIRAVVNFCYTTEIDFTSDVPTEEVLKLAHKYMIADLVAACDENLSLSIDKENVCARIRLSYLYSLEKLTQKTQEFVVNNIHDVYATLRKELVNVEPLIQPVKVEETGEEHQIKRQKTEQN